MWLVGAGCCCQPKAPVAPKRERGCVREKEAEFQAAACRAGDEDADEGNEPG